MNKKNKWKKITPMIDFLSKLSKIQRKQFLTSAKPHIIKNLVDLIYNFISPGHFPVPPEILQKLRPLEKELKLICQKKVSLQMRKKLLMKNDCLGRLFSIIVPVLNEVLFLKNKE